MAKKLTVNKAKEILTDGSVHGKPLTLKQKRFFGAIAGGAPIKSKTGGWLDSYQEGGVESRQAGYTDIPFNYNSAWGGQFEDGGEIPQAQNGLWSTNKRAYVDSALNANKNIDWVNRLYDANPKAVIVPGEKHSSTHLIGDNDQGYVFPRIVNMNGQLVDLGDGAEDYARETNTGIQFPKEQGTWFARSTGDNSGYKMGTGVLKGKPVMQKYKSIDKKAMGGSLPGSVGFTYARTNSPAPSEGPYAKKTMPSAEYGMSYYQHGLDWKPRNISENGSEIPRAQTGLDWMGGDPAVQLRNRILQERLQKPRVSKQASVGPARKESFFDKQRIQNLKQQYVDKNPYSELDENNNIVPKYTDRTIEGRALPYTRAAALDKGMGVAMDAVNVASVVTGLGSIASNALRLGAGALERQIGRNIVSRNLKNVTSKVNPYINQADDVLAYAQMDPIGIMGNRINSRHYNPQVALNVSNNTLTGVDRNLKNTAIESADLTLGENNLANVIGSVESQGGKFASEINWGKWNPDTPKYPQLINEYNAIEESTKKSGTWMKNPDGSAFQGTPEQFIQQQSSYFKKAFGDSKLLNPDGSPMFLYHGSAKKFDTFDPSKFQLGDAGYSGAGIYTTPSKTTADSYSLSSAKFHTRDIEPTVYQLYGQGNRPIKSSDLIKENEGRDLFNFYRDRNFKGELSPYESLRDYDVAVSDQLPNVQNIRPLHDAREIVFPRNTQVKSAVGNVGFFDMTNPNIYKALIPAVVGAAALQKQKKGGVIKDDRGQWAHPGEITEIGSNRITMQGVPYPVLGISDTGHTQMMLPGEEYKFKGSKVTEIPITKKVNQKSTGGWLDGYK